MLFDHTIPCASQSKDASFHASLTPNHPSRREARLAVAAGIALLALAQSVLADTTEKTSAKRKDHPLALTLWSPPPQVTHATPSAQLATRTQHKALLVDAKVPFVLPGATSNPLYEGTLHIHGDNTLGEPRQPLHMYTGASLNYAADATFHNPVEVFAGTDPAASAIWRVDHGTATQLGIVTGTAPIVKEGAGTLYVAGGATNSALTVINQGTLGIKQLFFAGTIQVNRNARLEGQGSVDAVSVQDGGVLAPGLAGTTGRLVIRNLSMHSGATLEIQARPNGDASNLYVQQTARLGGHVHALAPVGAWQPHTQYTIVQAPMGFDGTRFDGASTNLPFLDPELSYDDQRVYLSLIRNQTPLDEAGETPTEDEVADTIDDGGNPILHDKIITLDRPRARQAFQQLSGSWSASIASRLLEDSRYLRAAALQHAHPARMGRGATDSASHADYNRAGAVASERSLTPYSWAHAFYASAHRGAQHDTPADTRDTSGLVLGWTRPVGNTLHGSAYLGLQQSTMRRDQHSHQAQVDSRHLGLALAGAWRGVQWVTGAAYTWHALHHQRQLSIAGLGDNLTGGTRGRTLQMFTEIIAPLRWLNTPMQPAPAHSQADEYAVGIAPFARLAWVNQHLNGHVEQGGPAALNIDRSDQSVLLSTLGLKATHTLRTPKGAAQLQGEVAWRHAAGDLNMYSRQYFRDDAGQRRFTSTGQALARHAWSLRLGLEADLGKRGTLGIAYDGQFARRQQDHGARLNVAWVF